MFNSVLLNIYILLLPAVVQLNGFYTPSGTTKLFYDFQKNNYIK